MWMKFKNLKYISDQNNNYPKPKGCKMDFNLTFFFFFNLNFLKIGMDWESVLEFNIVFFSCVFVSL